MQPNDKPRGRVKIRAEKIATVKLCDHCNTPDGAEIRRFTAYLRNKPAVEVELYSDQYDNVYKADTSEEVLMIDAADLINHDIKPIRVKLYLTYLDNDPANEAPYNTRLLCQKCFKRFTAAVRRLRLQLKEKKDKDIRLKKSETVEAVQDPNQLNIFTMPDGLDYRIEDGPEVILPGVPELPETVEDNIQALQVFNEAVRLTFQTWDNKEVKNGE